MMTDRPMDEATLKNIVGQKITGALGYMGGMLSKERLKAEQYYKGEPFGDEQSGRSQVVSRDVAEAIDSMLPPLLKPFTSIDDMVRFDPRKPEDEQTAKEATQYVNWVWSVKNPGFAVMHDWFKDALWKKLGVIKIFWEQLDSVEKETYQGLTDQEFQMLAADQDVEIVKHEMRTALYSAPQIGIAPGPQTQQVPSQTVHDVVLKKSKKYGCVRIANVPPEEFLIDHRAVTLEEAGFLCHRSKKTITELKEMGFDPKDVESLGPDGAEDFNMERIERFKDEDAYPYRDDNYSDPSMREVWISECYIKIDYDGDGFAELRQVILAGESTFTILSNEEVDDHPFATLTAVPMPHKVIGMSIADQTEDIQRIKSALWRGGLDSIYFSVAPQMGMIEGQVNLDDLLNRRPGGVVRMKSSNALMPIPTQALAGEVFQMIEYADSVRETRTGVKRFTSTLDADQVNPLAKTATAAMLADNAAADRLELIARIFAETGVKRACKRILELICKHQNQPEIIRLNGKFVQFDPREWTTQMDVCISVGLGTGNRDKELQALLALGPINQQILTLQQGLNGPFLTADKVYNYLAKLIEMSGLRTPELYYNDPATAPMPAGGQKPDPAMVQAQAKAQAVQMQTQAQIQGQQAKAQADLAIEQQRSQHEMEIARQKAIFDAMLEHAKAQHAQQLEEMKLSHKTMMDAQIAAAKAEQIRTKPQAGI